MDAEKQDNPYLALCPCCGEFICLKCVEIDAKFEGLCGCDECNRYQRRLEARQAAHIAKYDHAIIQEREGKSDE